MPQRLRLLKVGKEGYTVGTGLRVLTGQYKTNQVTITHEQLVAILTGLLDTGEITAIAGDAVNAEALADAARHARRQLAGVAWTLKVCSWDNTFKAIDHDGNPFHQSD